MSAVRALVVSLVLTSTVVSAQTPASAPGASTFFAVSYVETSAASAPAAAAALRRYRDASRTQDGFVSIQFFEQAGRPGHFVVIETWRDARAFEARPPSAQEQLFAALAPIRVSGYDQRPYKVLDTAAGDPVTDRAVVFVITHVDVSPSPQVPVLLQRLAEASRQEPGNLRFDIMQHTMRANHFTVVEAWRDQQALDAHVAATHTRQYREDLQPFTGSPLDERVYKAHD
jgi:quinol monooxygenase YgiN